MYMELIEFWWDKLIRYRRERERLTPTPVLSNSGFTKYKGDMTELLTELTEDLQSAISYTGGDKVRDL